MNQARAETPTCSTREERLRKALFQGDKLRLDNSLYLRSVAAILDELLRLDLGSGDVTAQALRLASEPVSAAIIAKEEGIAAGIDEVSWLLGRSGIKVTQNKRDGDSIRVKDTLLELEGSRGVLLSHERVGLNVLQRMSGIASSTRHLQELAHRHNPGTHIVGTRKTPCGLLDKRALHLGGGGTHRLGLWDAILIKNNHLALLANREEEAVGVALERAWSRRGAAAFIEVEVSGKEPALAAARVFRRLQEEERRDDEDACPCLLLLDNVSPAETSRTLQALRSENLLDYVLIEASGNISESNLEAYAACGVDAISMGVLTHSPRGLDLCQKF
jgi:nicotinate-nucleotide pyrophosphorylase (carboxylating)